MLTALFKNKTCWHNIVSILVSLFWNSVKLKTTGAGGCLPSFNDTTHNHVLSVMLEASASA